MGNANHRQIHAAITEQMNLSFIDSLPTEYTEIDSFLRDRDFACDEEDTCDSVRWVLYYREFKRDSSNILIRVVLRFELSISDSPTATHNENHDLHFNDAFLELWDRQMQSDGFFMGVQTFDEESESLRIIGSYSLRPANYSDVEILFKLFD
jgi:hypothetical protein